MTEPNNNSEDEWNDSSLECRTETKEIRLSEDEK